MEVNPVRRPRMSIWLAFFLLAFYWMTPVLPKGWSATVETSTESSAENRYWFDPQRFVGESLTYLMTTTGSIHVRTPDDPGQMVFVKLTGYVDVSIGTLSEDETFPFTLRMFNIETEGFSQGIASGLSNVNIRGQLSPRGAITRLETPDVLSQIGLDSLDLFSGLFVPGPELQTAPHSRWDVNFSRIHVGSSRPRTVRIIASYAHEGMREWGNRPLESVTSRSRGNASWLEGSGRTEVQEVSSGLFYVEPSTGATSVSSVSKTSSIDVIEQRLGTVRTRNMLTTTLEIVNEPVVIIDPAEFGGPPVTEYEREPSQQWLYQDPAGRFELHLPMNWQSAQVHHNLHITTIAADHANETVNVHVVPLPSSGASSLTIARLALTSYQEVSNGFQLIEDLSPFELDGETAYIAQYSFESDHGEKVTRRAVFARHKDRAYYVQLSTKDDPRMTVSDGLTQFKHLLSGFRFGPTPQGEISAEQLAGSLTRYTDPSGRFSLLVPSLWPLVDRGHDGSTTTFTELGGRGYLTVFAQPGAGAFTARDIIASWKNQWERENGFELVHDLTDTPLSGHEGVLFEYRWDANTDEPRTRRVHAIVVQDYLYALILDYVDPGFENRRATFDHIFSSMQLITEAVDLGEGDFTAGESPAFVDEPDRRNVLETASPEIDESVVLSGRILTRFPDDTGQVIVQPAARVEVTILIGSEQFTTVTDEAGYMYAPNLPRLGEGLYTITRLRGNLFGFPQVGVNLENLGFERSSPNTVETGTINLVMDENFNLTIQLTGDQ